MSEIAVFLFALVAGAFYYVVDVLILGGVWR